MRSDFLRLALRLLTGLLLAACLSSPVAAEAQGQELKLGVLHVNDTHGHLLPFKLNGEAGWGGFPRLKAMLERERADGDYAWITLHAGDLLQGTPLSNLLTGAVDFECLSRMGFDAMCLGNHEF